MATSRTGSFDHASRSLHWEEHRYIDPVDGRVLPGASARGGVDAEKFAEVMEHGDNAHPDVPLAVLDGGKFGTQYNERVGPFGETFIVDGGVISGRPYPVNSELSGGSF